MQQLWVVLEYRDWIAFLVSFSLCVSAGAYTLIYHTRATADLPGVMMCVLITSRGIISTTLMFHIYYQKLKGLHCQELFSEYCIDFSPYCLLM